MSSRSLLPNMDLRYGIGHFAVDNGGARVLHREVGDGRCSFNEPLTEPGQGRLGRVTDPNGAGERNRGALRRPGEERRSEGRGEARRDRNPGPEAIAVFPRASRLGAFILCASGQDGLRGQAHAPWVVCVLSPGAKYPKPLLRPQLSASRSFQSPRALVTVPSRTADSP